MSGQRSASPSSRSAAARRAASSSGTTSASSGTGEARFSSPVSAGEHRYFLYTPELHLMAETELTTAPHPIVDNEYIWFDGMPVAQQDSTGETRWTFTDHLGTPILQTSSLQGIVWRAEYEPYGRIFELRAQDIHQPLRLPGQEAEQLNGGANGATEKSYSVFRWYDADAGRFQELDPLGFSDGPNTFIYVQDHPTRFTDPLGLAIKRCFRPLRSPMGKLLTVVASGIAPWWNIVQPPVPGASLCLAHEYLWNTDEAKPNGFDPSENSSQETGRDVCYTIPEPVGQCVWKYFNSVGKPGPYHLFSHNCQDAINRTVEYCKSCILKPPPVQLFLPLRGQYVSVGPAWRP